MTVSILSHVGLNQPKSMRRYVQALERHLTESSSRELSFSFPAKPFTSWSRGPAAIARYFGIPLATSLGTFDVLHITDQNLAWYGSFAPTHPVIVTVHDVFAFSGGANSFLGRAMLPLAAIQIRRANQLIAVSNVSAQSACDLFRVPRSRVSIVSNTVDAVFRPLSSDNRVAVKRQFCGQHTHLMVQVGTAIPRKNRPLAIMTLALLKRERELDPLLVFVGPGPTGRERSLIQEENLGADVVFLQDLDDCHLGELLGSADAYLCTSSHEGFCLPAVEALASGCPVVSVDSPTLQEVLQDAAAFAAANPRALAAELSSVLTNVRDREEIVARGLRQAVRYSPHNVIPQLLDVYRRVA